MASRKLVGEPPYKTRAVAGDGLFAAGWQAWFQGVRNAARCVEATATFDPGSIPSGDVSAATLTGVEGARVGDVAVASFSAPDVGVAIMAQVTATDTVTVYFFNVSGVSVDLAEGTIRARVWRQVD